MINKAFVLPLIATAFLAACGPAAPAAAPTTAPPASPAANSAATTAPASAASSAPSAGPSAAPSAGAAAAHPNLSGQTIRVIYNGSPSLATVLLVHAEQILKDWGAKVDTNYGGTAQIVLGAMVNNQADVLEFSPQGALSGVNSGVNVKAFALDGPRMDYALIGTSNIKTLADLKGARIGVLDTTGLNGVQVSLALAAGGLQPKDATVIATGGQSARVAAMASGRIDATMVGYSNWLTLQSQGYNLLYSYTKEQPKLMDGVLWATPEWLSRNHEAAVAFNQAEIESFRWFNDPSNKPAFIKETAALIKGSDDNITGQMYDVYKENGMYPVNAILNKDDLAFNQKQYVEFNSLPQELPIDQWADDSFAKEALAKEGTR